MCCEIVWVFPNNILYMAIRILLNGLLMVYARGFSWSECVLRAHCLSLRIFATCIVNLRQLEAYVLQNSNMFSFQLTFAPFCDCFADKSRGISQLSNFRLNIFLTRLHTA